MEIFQGWHPDLNKRHFPRSADSEYVAVLAGQRSDGVIVPINVSLIDGTTDQYALASNTEISVPPITLGKVIIQGVDTSGTKHDILATPNPDGSWNLSLTSPTLAQESSQLTQIDLLQNLIVSNSEGMTNIISALNGLSISIGDITVNTDELELLTRLNTATVADGITLLLATLQTSTYSLQEGLTDLNVSMMEGMTNIVTLVSQEVVQLSTLESLISQQVTQLSDIQVRMATEVTQLSVLHALSGLCINSPTLNQEITQLSVLQELQGLCVSAPTLNQEITQLSILHEMEHLCISVGDVNVNTDQLETLTSIQTATIAEGFTDVLIGLTDIKILESQQISQLSDIEIRVSTETTQLSILTQLQGLTFDSPALNQEVTQLSILHEMEHLCISVGDVNVNTDELETLVRVQTATIAEGFTEILISEWQIVDQLSNVLTTTASEVTQLSILYDLQGLCFVSTTLSREVTQLSVLHELEHLSVSVGEIVVDTGDLEDLSRIQTATIADGFTNIFSLEAQEITQLSDLQLRLATEETQLSIYQEMKGLCINSPSLAQETTQLSILYDIEGLCFNFSSTTLSQEVTQLSVLQTLEGLSLTTTGPHGKYYAVETTQPAGMTDVAYNFGVRMQDVFLATSNPVSVKFGSIANSVINLANGRFSFEWQNTDMMFVTTTTIPVDLQIYANGGTA